MTVAENLKRGKRVERFLFWGFISVACFLSFLNLNNIYTKLIFLFLFTLSYIPTAYNFINISGQIGEDWALGWSKLSDKTKNIIKNILKGVIYVVISILTLFILIKLVRIALGDPLIKDTLEIISIIVVIVGGLFSIAYKIIKISKK